MPVHHRTCVHTHMYKPRDHLVSPIHHYLVLGGGRRKSMQTLKEHPIPFPPKFFHTVCVCHCALAEKETHGLFFVWDPRMKHFSNRLALYPHNEVRGFEEDHFSAFPQSTKSEQSESSFSWLRQFHKIAPQESVQLLRDWSCSVRVGAGKWCFSIRCGQKTLDLQSCIHALRRHPRTY